MTLRSAFLNLTEKKIDWELVLCEMNKTSLCNYLIRLSIVILRTFIGENQVNLKEIKYHSCLLSNKREERLRYI